MRGAYGDGFERARRRVGPPAVVRAPAGDGVVGVQAARMQGACGDGFERARWCISLPVGVAAPAGDGVVGAQAARMPAARGDGLERARRRTGWACRVDCDGRLAAVPVQERHELAPCQAVVG